MKVDTESLPIWVYWEGPKPEFIELCLKSIKHHCEGLDLRIVGSEWVELLPPGYVSSKYLKVKELGVRSDVVRAALLARYGGVYLDADTICLKPPTSFFSDMFLYSSWSREPLRHIAGYVSAPKNCPIAMAWLNRVNKLLESDVSKAKWLALGEGSLTPCIEKYRDLSEKVPLSTFLPIEIDCKVADFFKVGDFVDYLTPDTFCFGLNHSWFMSRKPNHFKPGAWRHARTVISSLLRYAENL